MSLDIEGTLSAHGGWKCERVGDGWRCWCGTSLLDYWPAGGVTPRDTAIGVAHRAHVAAVLREQIEGALASEALVEHIANWVPLGFEDRDPYRTVQEAARAILAELAAHLSDTERVALSKGHSDTERVES